MQIVRLSSGTVTQNGNWISYKTSIYGKQISLYQKLANELMNFLSENNILFRGGFEAEHAYESVTRKGCITVKTYSVDNDMKSLPYEADSIN